MVKNESLHMVKGVTTLCCYMLRLVKYIDIVTLHRICMQYRKYTIHKHTIKLGSSHKIGFWLCSGETEAHVK